MKSYSWILILVLFLSGFSSCHSDAERYKDILREGSWYVYDIDYSYKLYDDFETPELFDFFHYLLDERNLLFLPGDELMFSKRRIDVNCPDGDRFGYDYYYSGDYIRIGRDGDYMDLFPQGDMNDLTLTLDRIGLENLLSYWAPVDEYYAYLLEAAYRNLYDFHITYHLQRPIPEMAQVMPGIYIGPMYDGNQHLMNEAAIITAKAGRFFINQNDIRQAFIKTGIGEEKRSKVISEKEKKITAYHEAGHAILFHLLPEMGPVHTISIIPTGMGAAGYTMPLPEQDEMFNSKKKMLENIVVDLGGRVAEELIFHDITTGASQDIKQATQMARAMVTQYGMSEKVGMIQYGSDEDEVFIGRDFGHTKNYADQTAALIDSEVKRIIDESYAKAKEILSQNEEVLHKCASLLIQKEKIGREEFEALF